MKIILWQKIAYLLCALIFCCIGLRFDIKRFRQSGDAGPSAPQQPPSSQADSYGPVPKTHRIMTLADHISVSHTHTLNVLSRHFSVIALTFFSVLQHIITQDFAKSQDPPSSSSSLPSSSSSSSFSSTFQSSGVGGVGRVKPPAPNAHHQRTPSRVSPENSDKPRAR